jgi:predicted Zn-dependent protease
MKKLWNKTPANSIYYQNYVKCLTELKQYDDAEKVVKKQMKKFPDDLTYYVDLGKCFS